MAKIFVRGPAASAPRPSPAAAPSNNLKPTRLLEEQMLSCPMSERLIKGAETITKARATGTGSNVTLRPDQSNVFQDAAEYLFDVATSSPQQRSEAPMARIILPPRTGKTVLAGEIIAGSGLTAVFIVPSQALVEQVRQDFALQLPDVPLGAYYGDEKMCPEHGIIVTTYTILQTRIRDGKPVPPAILHAALIFADEGHETMTEQRQRVLRELFDARAVRIALTATPDYDEEDRRLGKVFPDLIHEITLCEAVELDLLAPARVWIFEADVAGACVTMRGGDYKEDTLSVLMSEAPMLEAAKAIRYAPENMCKSALLCAVTRQQAMDLCAYLETHKPEGTSSPGVILGNTPSAERREIIRRYDAGEIDTIINVGVLLRGWSSQRCKLLVDLAPSASLVRATQKFFRPMTRWGEEEAHIYMVVPQNLPSPPITPMEIFAWSSVIEEYTAGELIASKTRKDASGERPVEIRSLDRVENVHVKTSVRYSAILLRPRLDPRDRKQVRRVLHSHTKTRPEGLPGIAAFRWLFFEHPLFTGRGMQLLRFCGFRPNREGYLAFMGKYMPEASTDLFLQQASHVWDDLQRRGIACQRLHVTWPSCEEDRLHLRQAILEGKELDRTVYGCYALAGGPMRAQDAPTPEESAEAMLLHKKLVSAMSTLTVREDTMLRMLYGVGHTEHSMQAIAEEFELTRSRVLQIVNKGLRKLRNPSRARNIWSFFDPVRPYDASRRKHG